MGFHIQFLLFILLFEGPKKLVIMLRTVIISLEGVNLESGFVPREMSLYYLHDKSYRHYFFERPDDLVLTENDQQTNRFYRDVMGGFDLETYIEGSLPFINLFYLILRHSSYSVYVVGNVSYKLLRETLPHYTNVTDIRDISVFVYPRSLEESGCGLNHSSPRYCSLAKLKVVNNFCSENL